MRTKEAFLQEYARWKSRDLEDVNLVEELQDMTEAHIEDSFYKDLEFGTGGLRGVIGAGTNRMNIYTVAKASQGLANYILENFCKEQQKIAVSFDSRIKSDVFARVATEVFAANGIQVFLYAELMPTPCLSYAVRALSCAAGIMVTASHNPAKYNGYKVYGSDGCQITTEAAACILDFMSKVDVLDDVKRVPFSTALADGRVSYINEDVYTAFVEEVKALSLVGEEKIDRNVKIVYSPLNGTGLKPVLRTLSELGYSNVTVVKEQEQPDGNFPTCPYPNPEIEEAMALGMEYARREDAELLLATDPDCDRVGIAVKAEDEYVLLSGNETGCLLLDYVCQRRIANGTMPQNPVMVKTIVTSELGEKIADYYGVRTINVLTGFKFIGEQIGLLEKQGQKDAYIFGFEESYGYLSGSHVRDKDAVNGVALICEMFAYYKTKGISLLERLNVLYQQFGYTKNVLKSYEFEGADGSAKMKRVMDVFRCCDKELCGIKVEQMLDYAKGIDGLPKSDVLKFYMDGDTSVVVRPSGTEPKMKVYLSVNAETKQSANQIAFALAKKLEKMLA